MFSNVSATALSKSFLSLSEALAVSALASISGQCARERFAAFSIPKKSRDSKTLFRFEVQKLYI
jgi:hypothetical protein